MEGTKPMPTKRDVAASLFSQPLVRAQVAFVVASLASLVLSVSLWFSGNESQGIFVGLWVPSILSAGTLLLSGQNRSR
jgi:hypothetical protein